VKCGCAAKGRMVFDRLPARDVISWNSMLAGYAQNEQPKNSHALFIKMLLIGPDDHTLTVFLSAVSSESPSCKLGREIHGCMMQWHGKDCKYRFLMQL